MQLRRAKKEERALLTTRKLVSKQGLEIWAQIWISLLCPQTIANIWAWERNVFPRNVSKIRPLARNWSKLRWNILKWFLAISILHLQRTHLRWRQHCNLRLTCCCTDTKNLYSEWSRVCSCGAGGLWISKIHLQKMVWRRWGPFIRLKRHITFIYDVSFEIPNTNFYDDSIMMNYLCTRNSNYIVF